MRKNSNKSFYHFASILYDENTGEEIEKKYFMTLKEMADDFQVHTSSLGKVIRFKKKLKKIPNVVFKRVYEPVLLKVPNELTPPKVSFYVEEIDTEKNKLKVSEKNQKYNFFEEEEKQNEDEVRVSLLKDNSLHDSIDNEFDNELLVNMNMQTKQLKSKEKKKKKNNEANINIKLVNDLDNLFIENHKRSNHSIQNEVSQQQQPQNEVIQQEEEKEEEQPQNEVSQQQQNEVSQQEEEKEEEQQQNEVSQQNKVSQQQQNEVSQDRQITIKRRNHKPTNYKRSNHSTISRLEEEEQQPQNDVGQEEEQQPKNEVSQQEEQQPQPEVSQDRQITIKPNRTTKNKNIEVIQKDAEDLVFFENANDFENYIKEQCSQEEEVVSKNPSSHKSNIEAVEVVEDIVLFDDAYENNDVIDNYLKEQQKPIKKVIAENFAIEDFDFFQDANELDNYYVC